MRYAVATVLVAAGLVAVGPAVTAATAAAAPAPRCEGRPATLVGAPGDPVHGTPGDDVVVSNGAASVTTFGGDDVVCLTGRPPTGRFTVAAGRGDDVVVNRTAYASRVLLGSGSDRFRGGPASDDVSVRDRRPGPDRIDLGAGPDRLDTTVHPVPGVRLRGGPGADVIVLGVDAPRGPVRVDNRRGRVRVGSRPPLRIAGFEDWSVIDGRRLTFLGSDADEVVEAVEVGRIDLGGGDDALLLSPLARVEGTISGGRGRDVVTMYASFAEPPLRGVDVDLESGRLVRYSAPGYPDPPPIALRRFNDVVLEALRVEVTGSRDADVLSISACTGTVDAAGDDTVTVDGRPENTDESDACGADDRLTVHGGDGDDTLLGSFYPDVLIGDAGTDTADGRQDVDRCEAETTTACELPARRADTRVRPVTTR